jgi:hypothetical protein
MTHSNGTSTGTATPTTAGSFVFCDVTATAGTAIAISDPASQLWSTAGTSLPKWFQGHYFKYNSASIASVTATPNGFGAIIMLCTEFSGSLQSSPFDKTSAFDNGYAGTVCTGCAFTTGATATTSAANELLITACVDQTAEQPVSYAAGSGWTAGVTTLDDAEEFLEWKVVSAAGAYTGTGTYSNVTPSSSYEVSCMISTFSLAPPAVLRGIISAGVLKSPL